LGKKIAATVTLIEAELAAHRIDANSSQNLLWVLHAFQTTGVHDVRALQTGQSTMETPNPAVTEAVHSIGQIQMDRRRLIYDALPGIRQRTAEVARTAETREQTEAMLTTLGKLQNSLEILSFDEGPPAPERTLDAEIALLHTVQAILFARDHGNEDVLHKAVQQLSSYSSDGPLGWTKADTENRISGLSKAVQVSLEEAQRSLDQSILTPRPVGELLQGLITLAKWHTFLGAVQPAGNKADREAVIGVYASLIEAVRAVEIRDADYLEKSLSEARNDLNVLGVDRAKTFGRAFDQWQAQVKQPARQESVDRGTSLLAQLEAVKTPTQLEALAVALKKPENGSVGESKPGLHLDPGQIQTLLTLATAWASSDPSLLPSENTDAGSGPPSDQPSQQLHNLRQRIAREVLSRALPAPQLLEAPLADQPLGKALDQLAHQLSDAHEWRRLLRLCEHRGDSFENPDGPAVARKETAAAIRSYLAGESLELGEQWHDALLAYRAVVATGAILGPVQQATERIAAITADRPASSALPPPP